MANALLERETIVLEDIKSIIEAVKSGSKGEEDIQPGAEQQGKDDSPVAAESAETGSGGQ
jgi:hypothetical protein